MDEEAQNKKLNGLLKRGRRLLDESEATSAHREFCDWVNDVADCLEVATNNPALSAKWSALPSSPLVMGGSYYDDDQSWLLFRNRIQSRLKWLGNNLPLSTDTRKQKQQAKISNEDVASRKIFIVHGHDEGAREAVARFLEKIGFSPIILHEQANRGRTVIEKVEAHSDVGFTVVLLTPDDVGGKNANELQARPRQNVLLELGYFLGRLGRERVCALKRGDIEVPSDFGGVVWTAFDDGGGWRGELGKELQAAGFDIDWNKIMRS